MRVDRMSDIKQVIIDAFGRAHLQNVIVHQDSQNRKLVQLIKSKFETQYVIPELSLNTSKDNVQDGNKKLNYAQTLGNRFKSLFF